MKKLAINSFLAATALAWLSPVNADETSHTIGNSGKSPSAELSDSSHSLDVRSNSALMDGLCVLPPQKK